MDFSLDFFLLKFSHFFKVHSFSYTFFLEISSDYKLDEFRSEQPSNPNFEYSPPSSRPHIGVGMGLVVPLESTDAYLFFWPRESKWGRLRINVQRLLRITANPTHSLIMLLLITINSL